MAAQESPEYGPPKGTLVIVGGGRTEGTGIVEKFIELAGGPDKKFVIVPTAGGNKNQDGTIRQYKEEDVVASWLKRGLKNVRMLHTHDPKVADTEEFASVLRDANAVWFNGGRQWNIVDSYMNTRTLREFHSVLARGGVIGGSSAGATIQGDYLVRGAVAGSEIVMTPEPEHEHGFSFLRRSAIDQHINARNRWDDLIPVIKKYPNLLGIGLSEGTAIVVTGDKFEVMGQWKVAVHDNTRAYQPWEKPYFVLSAGDVYNMKLRKVEKYGNGVAPGRRPTTDGRGEDEEEAAASGRTVIVQTNAAGDNVHFIDPSTNKVVGEVTGIEVPHGAAATSDGRRFYFSNESQDTLDIVDGEKLRVLRGVPLSGRPNNVAISRDGKRVYVAIIQAPGAVDVIDTATMARVKTIPTKGGIHNVYVTPDGRFVVAGSIAGRSITVIDQKTEETAWTMDFDNGVRPIAFEKKPDGSTKRMFVQISNFHGFYVVDFDQRKEVARIELPAVPPAERHTEGLQGSPSHGIGVTPDGRTLWVCSKVNSHIYGYSMPDLKLLGGVRVGDHPDWLTFTPDSKRVYVANAGSNSVSAVDIATRKEMAKIPVGQVPKRNITAVLP